MFTGLILTGAGVVEELGGRAPPVSRRRWEEWIHGLKVRVADLLLQLLLGKLCHWVKEDQLPLSLPLLHLYGLHLCRGQILDMGEARGTAFYFPPPIKCSQV